MQWIQDITGSTTIMYLLCVVVFGFHSSWMSLNGISRKGWWAKSFSASKNRNWFGQCMEFIMSMPSIWYTVKARWY